MKKSILISALFSAVLLSTSCKKIDLDKHQKETILQTVNAALKSNESYTFTLPASSNYRDEFKITTQAAHAGISLIGRDAKNNLIYQYTPASGYAGADQVVISTVDGRHGNNSCFGFSNNNGCGNYGCGNNNHHEDQDMVITINLIIYAQG